MTASSHSQDGSGAGRVDVHHHVVPPFYADWLRSKGFDASGLPIPQWTADAALALMDSQGIASSVLSVSTPGVHLGNDADARRMAREVNDFSADVVASHPGRFGFFATLTVPDVESAIEEACYALDNLHADGVTLLANTHGVYLGELDLEPLFAELDRRGTVVFVHPNALPGPPLAGVPSFAVDFLLDTTRAAVNLVRTGVVNRYPNLKIILAHAGGFVPYAAQRIAITVSFLTSRSVREVLSDLRTLYFDTALSSPSALPSLIAFAPPGHVLYGSDWPYAPTPVVEMFTRELDVYGGMSPTVLAQITRTNACALFPRLSRTQSEASP